MQNQKPIPKLYLGPEPEGPPNPWPPTVESVLETPLGHVNRYKLQIVLNSEVLGEKILIIPDDFKVPDSETLVTYRVSELMRIILNDALDTGALQKLHLVKKKFGGRIAGSKDCRTDEMKNLHQAEPQKVSEPDNDSSTSTEPGMEVFTV